MDWTSIEDGLPNDGEESVVVGMKSDGSIVQLIGYRENGNWVMEDEAAAAGGVRVLRWTPLSVTRTNRARGSPTSARSNPSPPATEGSVPEIPSAGFANTGRVPAQPERDDP